MIFFERWTVNDVFAILRDNLPLRAEAKVVAPENEHNM